METQRSICYGVQSADGLRNVKNDYKFEEGISRNLVESFVLIFLF